MTTPTFKPAKDLKAGNKVKNNQGETLTIAKISKGFFKDSLQLDFKEGGWSCIGKEEQVEII